MPSFCRTCSLSNRVSPRVHRSIFISIVWRVDSCFLSFCSVEWLRDAQHFYKFLSSGIQAYFYDRRHLWLVSIWTMLHLLFSEYHRWVALCLKWAWIRDFQIGRYFLDLDCRFWWRNQFSFAIRYSIFSIFRFISFSSHLSFHFQAWVCCWSTILVS